MDRLLQEKCFKSINKNPNFYYYRFNKTGESQGKGAKELGAK